MATAEERRERDRPTATHRDVEIRAISDVAKADRHGARHTGDVRARDEIAIDVRVAGKAEQRTRDGDPSADDLHSFASGVEDSRARQKIVVPQIRSTLPN